MIGQGREADDEAEEEPGSLSERLAGLPAASRGLNFNPAVRRSEQARLPHRPSEIPRLFLCNKTPGTVAMSHHKRPQIMQPWLRLKIGHAGTQYCMTSRRLIERPASRITAIAAFAVLASFASLPHAQAAGSPCYVGFQVPVMFIDDTVSKTTGSNMIQGNAVSYSAKATSEYKAGFKLAGMVGYRFGGSLRVEGELFFARAKVDKQTYANIVSAGIPVPVKVNVPISGSASQAGAMANVWLDIPTGSDWTPYFGGGVGLIRVDQGDLEYDANTLANRLAKLQNAPEFPTGFVPEISSTDTAFAYHFGAGVGYRLNDRTVLQFGYRLQTANDLEFDGRNALGNAINVKTELRMHLFEIGVRMRF